MYRKRKTNERIRTRITSVIEKMPPGSFFNVDQIVAIFKHRRLGVDNRRIGVLMRDRDDVRHISAGKWMVL